VNRELFKSATARGRKTEKDRERKEPEVQGGRRDVQLKLESPQGKVPRLACYVLRRLGRLIDL